MLKKIKLHRADDYNFKLHEQYISFRSIFGFELTYNKFLVCRWYMRWGVYDSYDL